MNNPFRNWQDIRVFLALVRQGSTLAAARTLGMSQPTVARRLDVLEHETQLTLFRRSPRGVCLTADGTALIPAAEALETAADAFARAAETRRHTALRPIRITATGPNFSARMAAILSEFAELHPDVRFEFVPSFRILDLAAGEADIALRIAKTIDDPTLICRKISDAQFTFYGSRRYAEARGLPASIDDLAGHIFATFRQHGITGRLFDWLADIVSDDQIVTVCEDIEAMTAAIQSGLGLGILNVAFARGREGLIPCFDPIPDLTTPQWMLIAPDAWTRPEVKDFVAFFAPRYAALFRDDGAQPSAHL